jgi:hypothetical protein
MIVSDFAMADDVAGLAILTSALEALDRANQARDILTREGLTVQGDRGGLRTHPCVQTERDNRAAFFQGMKLLRLDCQTEPIRSGPGRPPGR